MKTYEHYVGTKATFRILNKKWTQQYSRGDKMWLPLERGATLVASRGDPGIARRLIVAYPKRPDVTIVGLDSSVRGAVGKLMDDFRIILKTCANVRPAGGNTPSSGIIMTVMALAMCDEVNLYGFGNGHGASGRPSILRVARHGETRRGHASLHAAGAPPHQKAGGGGVRQGVRERTVQLRAKTRGRRKRRELVCAPRSPHVSPAAAAAKHEEEEEEEEKMAAVCRLPNL